MLTQEEKLDILSEFPNVKLCYEKIIHKKVYDFDLLLAIPDGKKCFAWFTPYKNNTPIIQEVPETSNIPDPLLRPKKYHLMVFPPRK